MDLTRTEIESEVDRIIAGRPGKVGLREHLLASVLHAAGHEVDVVCPKCRGVITVTDFPMENGHTIECPCGTCSGSMRGL